MFGKKKGIVSVNIELPDSYHINIAKAGNNVPLSMPINLRYRPVSADLPPKIRTLSARLHACTEYNVDSRHSPHLGNAYSTSLTILNASTPSTSTPLWLEDSNLECLSFVSNILMPMNLPPAAGLPTNRGGKVLVPSFDSCFVSRSYEVEVKIGFEGGDVVVRVPTSVIAKPATLTAERELEAAIRAADDWTPPGHEVVADVVEPVEPELLRPTALNLATDDIQRDEPEEMQPEDIGQSTPPDYELLVAVDKIGVQLGVTAMAA
jgi:hypothetical protein